MCVAVTLEPGAEMTLDEVYKMGMANGDGVGFAWADGTAVHWLKAIRYNPKKVMELINSHAQEFRLLHFRLSTVGGVKAELCHPFEIGPKADYRPAGSGSKVLIHNGHWRRWDDVFDIMKKENILPDTGPWSDTRFAALAASWDMDWLDTVDGKVAVMDFEGNTKFWGNWDKLREGIKVSNTYWQSHNYDYKRSGNHRSWMGWGWTEWEWKEYERHQSDALQARMEAEEKLNEKDDKEGTKSEGKQEGKKEKGKGGKGGNHVEHDAGSRLGDGPRTRWVYDAERGTWRDPGVNTGSGDGEGKHVQLAKGSNATGMENEKGQFNTDEFQVSKWVLLAGKEGQEAALYDHRPWNNKATGKWYWIPWDCEYAQKSRIEQLTETRARSLLEQITAALSARGGQGGTQEGGSVSP